MAMNIGGESMKPYSTKCPKCNYHTVRTSNDYLEKLIKKVNVIRFMCEHCRIIHDVNVKDIDIEQDDEVSIW